MKINQKNFLFWQPSTNLYQYFLSSRHGEKILVISNYASWLFLAIVSFSLVAHQANIFWQLFFSTLISEIIEKYLKTKKFWPRPAFMSAQNVPTGLIKSWYLKGSFPSGHAIKMAFFFLFILQYQVFSPVVFCLITLPLLFFRVLIGFHYPIDVFGGWIIGWLLWFFIHLITFPDYLVLPIKTIFDAFV